MEFTTYLPLQKFHIVPLTNLDPKSIKISAKKTINDREEIKHSSKLNAISAMLDVSGGFANYENFYQKILQPFLDEKGLKRRKNLLKQKYSGEYPIFSELKRQNISERLFYSNRPIPKKLFTGHNFPFSEIYSFHADDIRLILKQILNNDYIKEIFVEDIFSDIFTTVNNCLNDSIEKIEKYAFEKVSFTINSKEHECFFIDVMIAAFYRVNFSTKFYHLLSNILTSDDCDDIILCSYISGNVNKEQRENIKTRNRLEARLVKIFKKRLSMSDSGWVNISQINSSIIFIYDDEGNYDFLIKNQRDKIFDHQVFGKYLKRTQIPSFIESYRFLRWHYFEYQGWRELDDHLSECFYYDKGNISANYPGSNAILQKFLIAKGIYQPLEKTYRNKLSGFKEFCVNGKSLMVSELITIDELKLFVSENVDYMRYRQGDNLVSVNSDDNGNLPASITFYDALAYIHWRESNEKIPFRLLSIEEYKVVSGRTTQPRKGVVYKTDLKFYSPEGVRYDRHPDYMPEVDFQNLLLKFESDPSSYKHNGLSFIDSDSFNEWLKEGCQISSKSLLSFYLDEYIERSCGPKDSTGKYKGIKTGMRICYELD